MLIDDVANRFGLFRLEAEGTTPPWSGTRVGRVIHHEPTGIDTTGRMAEWDGTVEKSRAVGITQEDGLCIGLLSPEMRIGRDALTTRVR